MIYKDLLTEQCSPPGRSHCKKRIKVKYLNVNITLDLPTEHTHTERAGSNKNNICIAFVHSASIWDWIQTFPDIFFDQMPFSLLCLLFRTALANQHTWKTNSAEDLIQNKHTPASHFLKPNSRWRCCRFAFYCMTCWGAGFQCLDPPYKTCEMINQLENNSLNDHSKCKHICI